MSFLIIRAPFIVLNCLLISSLFDFRLIIHLFVLHCILNLVLLMFINIVSLRNYQPIDLNEKLFSRSSKENFSFFPFLGLFATFSLTVILIIILAIVAFYVSLIIFLMLLLLTIIIYFNVLKYSSNYFIHSKEKVYNGLIVL
jgi:hypothetical protein